MTDYFVRPTNGSDGAAGTSFAAAFATTQMALDTVAAGDVVYLIPEATETTAVPIDIDTTTGTFGSKIKFLVGNTSDGGVDYSLRYDIQLTASGASVFEFAANIDYYYFYGVRLDGNSLATNCVSNQADSVEGIVFENGRTFGATGDGVSVRGASTPSWSFINQECDNNGGKGYSSPANNRGKVDIIGGSCHDNGGDGIEILTINCKVINCLVYGNTGIGIDLAIGNSDTSILMYNTLYNNGSHGIALSNAAGISSIVLCNTMSGNGGYGLFRNGVTTEGQSLYCDYNNYFDNTSGNSDVTLLGQNNTTTDPDFADAASGDFIPSSTSPLNRAGIGGSTVGALPAADPAGGGSGGLIKLLNNGLIS